MEKEAALPNDAPSGWGGTQRLCCKKTEENAEDVKFPFPVQLRWPLQRGWR
jgi:hypothetical protein